MALLLSGGVQTIAKMRDVTCRLVEISVPVARSNPSSEPLPHSDMYPAYAHVVLKLHRVGPTHISECGTWLPPRMRVGEEISRGVEKVVYAYR